MRKSIANLLYPPACLVCHRPLRADTDEARAPDHAEALLCAPCRAGVEPLMPPLCRHCGLSLSGAYDADMECRECRSRPFAFAQARAAFVYRSTVREAIHAFKYHERHRLGRWLATAMAQTARAAWPPSTIDVVVPVPMHRLKRWMKGFNPAATLAEQVAATLDRPYRPAELVRTRWTRSQTRLAPRQRLRNVAGAFRSRANDVDGATVLLVDDVFTTGATIHACATALRDVGAHTVLALTAAATPP